MILILMFAAVVVIVIGLFKDPPDVLEGAAILCAVGVVVSVSAWNDWSKEKEFRQLQEVYSRSQTFCALRGRREVELQWEEIVVGDLLKLG